jgi:hypothetical protein
MRLLPPATAPRVVRVPTCATKAASAPRAMPSAGAVRQFGTTASMG